MCDEVGTTPCLPRMCSGQKHRSNTPASDPCEYYRRTITIPLLDHLLAELERRFSPHQKLAMEGLYLIPSVLVTKDLPAVSSVIIELGKLYVVDHHHLTRLVQSLAQDSSGCY